MNWIINCENLNSIRYLYLKLLNTNPIQKISQSITYQFVNVILNVMQLLSIIHVKKITKNTIENYSILKKNKLM